MNMENMRKLVARLEKLKTTAPEDGIGFNMRRYYARELDDNSGHACGTTMCLAGHACEIAVAEGAIAKRADSPSEYFDQAKQWLGLADDMARRLFWYWRTHSSSLDGAIATLKKAVENNQAAVDNIRNP